MDLGHQLLAIVRDVWLPVLRTSTKAVHVVAVGEITKDKGAYFALPVVMPHMIILIISMILVGFD